MNSIPPPLPPSPPRGWWSRHWKWAVPACVVTLIGMVGGFFFLIFTTVFGLMKSSEPYKFAMSRANSSAEIRTALGSPIEPGMFMSGNISTTNSSGHASMAIPISGPKGEASLHVEADRSGGIWTYKTLEVHIPGQPAKVDLKP